jgi:hypothetical protein
MYTVTASAPRHRHLAPHCQQSTNLIAQDFSPIHSAQACALPADPLTRSQPSVCRSKSDSQHYTNWCLSLMPQRCVLFTVSLTCIHYWRVIPKAWIFFFWIPQKRPSHRLTLIAEATHIIMPTILIKISSSTQNPIHHVIWKFGRNSIHSGLISKKSLILHKPTKTRLVWFYDASNW